MNKYIPSAEESLEFAKNSSLIEGEESAQAFRDHLQAWEYMRGVRAPLTKENILECHRILLENLNPRIAGKQRSVNVFVGGYMAPVPELLNFMFVEWLDNWAIPPETEKEIMWSHVTFEKIHPFEDGNGRVGRCIMNWHRINLGLPLIIIHPGKEQKEYYQWFRQK